MNADGFSSAQKVVRLTVKRPADFQMPLSSAPDPDLYSLSTTPRKKTKGMFSSDNKAMDLIKNSAEF
jgi:hypothetical protein